MGKPSKAQDVSFETGASCIPMDSALPSLSDAEQVEAARFTPAQLADARRRAPSWKQFK